MTRARRPLAGLLLAGALLAVTGCASSVDPIERLGRRAAEGVGPSAVVVPAARGPVGEVRHAAHAGRPVRGSAGAPGAAAPDGAGEATLTETAARMFRTAARSWPHGSARPHRRPPVKAERHADAGAHEGAGRHAMAGRHAEPKGPSDRFPERDRIATRH
ncbi:hypothetical protein EAO71_29290 [Streptomyces sp. ms191]|nr:hypothetical protein EAO71_29290 [Streptomyces sp. ms191]